jgi:hypothetical protein
MALLNLTHSYKLPNVSMLHSPFLTPQLQVDSASCYISSALGPVQHFIILGKK